MKFSKFESAVHFAACRIPFGKVSTYSQIAKAIGNPNASRAVGNALNKSPGMPKCPCHRVIKSDGKIGGFAHGAKKKIELLKKEGVKIENGRIPVTLIFKFKNSSSIYKKMRCKK